MVFDLIRAVHDKIWFNRVSKCNLLMCRWADCCDCCRKTCKMNAWNRRRFESGTEPSLAFSAKRCTTAGYRVAWASGNIHHVKPSSISRRSLSRVPHGTESYSLTFNLWINMHYRLDHDIKHCINVFKLQNDFHLFFNKIYLLLIIKTWKNSSVCNDCRLNSTTDTNVFVTTV